MSKEFHHINLAFEKSITQMQDNLQYLINKGNVSQRFINKQNLILRNLIEYQQFTHSYIQFLENENATIHIERREKVQELHDRIISFEAICIIHGVMNFPMWLSFGKTLLRSKAIALNTEYKMQLPDMLNDKLSHLPYSERIIVENILFKKQNEKIQALLDKINARSKQHLNYGIRTEGH